MRRAGHGIFVDAGRRREEARNKIAVVARRRGNAAKGIELAQRIEIGLQRMHISFRCEYCEVVA